MGDKSAIEWTDATWNVLRGCSRVSEGCRNCYAERAAVRQIKSGYRGLVKSSASGPRWTGEVRFVEEALTLPLKWRSPRRIFVNSMSDLFHEKVPDEWLHRIYHVMEQARHHTFQILTKRPERMREYLSWRWGEGRIPSWHIWHGVSVEDQATADERIPLLLETPAAVRFLSVEPLLGPVNLTDYLDPCCECLDPHDGGAHDEACPRGGGRLGWVIVGGESGPGARPCDLAWIRTIVAQCREAGVPCFVKQLGAVIRGDGVGFSTIHHWIRRDGAARFLAPLIGPNVGVHPRGTGWDDADFRLCDAKGGAPYEWPEDLRVRESPAMEREAR